MIVFVSGGCKNGKSTYAENIAVKLSKNGNLYYVATMLPVDDEDKERIVRHKKSREGKGFATVECGKDISQIMNVCDTGTILLDSVTALLANEMFCSDGSVNKDAHIKIVNELKKVIDSVENIVFVSDYIYSDSQVYDELIECYRKSLSFIDCYLAKLANVVIDVSYTTLTFYKGKSLIGEIL